MLISYRNALILFLCHDFTLEIQLYGIIPFKVLPDVYQIKTVVTCP